QPVKSVQTLISFKNPEQLSGLITRSDQELGGFSTVNLDVEGGVGHFHGVLNLDPPSNKPEFLYSGYAMFRTKDQPSNGSFLFPQSQFWDWDNFHNVVLRVKGDHRKYFVNIQSQTSVATDLYQHRLFLTKPGEWETVTIPIDDFVLTNRGIIQHQAPMDRTRVKTLGIGLTDGQFGEYSLYIDEIKVERGDEEAQRKREEKEKEQVDSGDTFSDMRT
ncbi:CIA30 family protein, partial [Cyberlindnera jadinii NRRL Y-1542]